VFTCWEHEHLSHSSEDGHPQKSVPYEVRLGTKIVMGISAPENFSRSRY